MFRKNSFFFKIFIPVIAVMLLQISIIGFVLVVTGSITSLEDAAVTTLTKNAESRGATLEQMMVHYWSNLDRLEMSVIELVDDYLEETDLSIYDVLGDYDLEISLLDRLSHTLIDSLRASASTGIYIYLLDEHGYREEPQTRNGLYYRDLDPLSNPADNSDIMYLKGYIDIARKDRIQLDSLWSEAFTFNPQDEDIWRSFSYPQIAAAQHPGISSVNLAYWNGPHLQNPHSVLDANKCITYTRPVFYNDMLIALIGSEVQVSLLEKHFPAHDMESGSHGGYMLVCYQTGQGREELTHVFHISGSYIRRLVGSEEDVIMVPSRKDGLFTFDSDKISEAVQIARRPLRLYNTNAPFSGEQWALVSLETENVLFYASRNVAIGLVISSLVAFILGSVLLVLTIKKSTAPLISIAGQIERSSHRESRGQPFVSGSNIYEINLLCATLNIMQDKQSRAEALVREERQRYLVALESVADTFMEYDTKRDLFILYYFSGESKKLMSDNIYAFSKTVAAGGFCHPDDVSKLLVFLQNPDSSTVVIRAKTTVFSHITDVTPDGDYYWFIIKASNILDDDGEVSKVIGTAKEVTREKLEEFARDEEARRDPTTGFYNRAYGVQAVRQVVNNAPQDTLFTLYIIDIANFDRLESFYGRVFGAFVLMEFADALSQLLQKDDIAVRLSNDEFLICFSGVNPDDAATKADSIPDIVASLYAGENTNIALSAHTRFIRSIGELPDYNFIDKPISVFLDVSKDNIVSSSFDLFERTSDIPSAIMILLAFLGRIYSFKRIIICSFDAEFGANQVAYQWARPGLPHLSSDIVRIPRADIIAFEDLPGKEDTFLFSDKKARTLSDGVLKMLCADRPEESADRSTFCCIIRDGEKHAGRALFISDKPCKSWSDKDMDELSDIVRIISANISVDKSQLASRAKSEFLSRISHEIRTPMNAIIGMTRIAKSVTDDPERLRDSLEQIDFSANHLLALINDVLEMSRIESGKLRIDNEPFTMDDLVSGTETLMRYPIESKGISFSIHREYIHNHVIGDAHRLRQVLVNLLGNANKFTEEGGTIALSIEQLDTANFSVPVDMKDFGMFKFSVSDTGLGINPEDQRLIFEAFGQASTLSGTHQQGTGLGLAISDSIVSAMGGKIELESTPGKGSCFYFVIPLEIKDANMSLFDDNPETVDYTDCFKGKRALLVDDVSSNVAVASFTLKETGVDIDVAHNGQQAVDMFFAAAPGYYDIILMDVKMPVMDGFTATRKIRSGSAERDDAHNIPIVAMTANAYDEDMKKTIESGMNGHISKPVVKEELFELMLRLIK